MRYNQKPKNAAVIKTAKFNFMGFSSKATNLPIILGTTLKRLMKANDAIKNKLSRKIVR